MKTFSNDVLPHAPSPRITIFFSIGFLELLDDPQRNDIKLLRTLDQGPLATTLQIPNLSRYYDFGYWFDTKYFIFGVVYFSFRMRLRKSKGQKPLPAIYHLKNKETHFYDKNTLKNKVNVKAKVIKGNHWRTHIAGSLKPYCQERLCSMSRDSSVTRYPFF